MNQEQDMLHAIIVASQSVHKKERDDGKFSIWF